MKNTTYWIAVSNKTGHINQCHALFESLNIDPEKVVIIPSYSRSNHWLKKVFKKVQAIFTCAFLLFSIPKGPLFLVTSARDSEYAAWIVKKWKGRDAFVVHLGRPVNFPGSMDVAVINRAALPKWRSRKEKLNRPIDLEEVHICGVLARRFPASEIYNNENEPISKRKHSIAVFIGGENKYFSLSGDHFITSMRKIAELATSGENNIEIVLSRRTTALTEANIREAVDTSPIEISGKNQSDRYRALLDSADCFIVTPDSVTMLCEVCALGRPVYILDLEQFSGAGSDGAAFVEDLQQRGVARRFNGEIETNLPWERLDEAARIAPVIAAHIREWREAGNGSG